MKSDLQNKVTIYLILSVLMPMMVVFLVSVKRVTGGIPLLLIVSGIEYYFVMRSKLRSHKILARH